jgi:hypothetical protein
MTRIRKLLLGAGIAAVTALPAAPGPAAAGEGEGGLAFNTATPRQQLVVGEHLMWRVDVQAGQTLSVRAGLDVPAGYPAGVTDTFDVQMYDPMRMPVSCSPDIDSGNFVRNAGLRIEDVCGPWLVGASKKTANYDYRHAGTYYIQVAVREAADKARGLLVPIDVTVSVEGQPLPPEDGVFDFGGGTPGAPPVGAANGSGNGTATPAPASAPGAPVASTGDPSDGGGWWPALGVMAVALVAGGLGGHLLRRRIRPVAAAGPGAPAWAPPTPIGPRPVPPRPPDATRAWPASPAPPSVAAERAGERPGGPPPPPSRPPRVPPAGV